MRHRGFPEVWRHCAQVWRHCSGASGRRGWIFTVFSFFISSVSRLWSAKVPCSSFKSLFFGFLFCSMLSHVFLMLLIDFQLFSLLIVFPCFSLLFLAPCFSSCFSLLFLAFLRFSSFFLAFLCLSLLFLAFRCFALLFIAFHVF